MRNDVKRFKNKIDGFRHHFKDMWNFLDAVTLIAFFVGFLFRYVSPHYMIMRIVSCLEVARIIFALDLMLFYLRTLDIFYLHRKLGPQLVMITEMVRYVCNVFPIVDIFQYVNMLLDIFGCSVTFDINKCCLWKKHFIICLFWITCQVSY